MNAVPIGSIRPSQANPRRRMDMTALAELTASVRLFGILSPVLLRPRKGGAAGYELVYGHRRFEAAIAAGLTEIPADVRELTDEQALEIQIVENRDREDIHPLDEAGAYQRFRDEFKHDAEAIAERVGRPVQFVKDRLRLMDLVEEAKDHFLGGRIHLGHAIILARLKPEEQKRAMDHGLFVDENVLFREDHEPDDIEEQPLKVRTVRELQGWVDSHVKLDVAAPILADLFPETHAAVSDSLAGTLKILPITHEYAIPPDAKDGERVYTSKSWRRADGKYKSKTCERSVTGIVMVGPGRGESFLVCTSRTSCKVHFADEIKVAAARAKHGTGSKAASKAASQASSSQSKWEVTHKLNELNREAFNASVPAITASLIKQLGKMDVKPAGRLADLLVNACVGHGGEPSTHMARGKDAKSLLRYLVLQVLEDEITEWNGFVEFPKTAKKLGFKLDGLLPKAITKLPAEAKGAKAAPARREVEDDEDSE